MTSDLQAVGGIIEVSPRITLPLALISAAVLCLTACVSHQPSDVRFPSLPLLDVKPEEKLAAAFKRDPEKSQPWLSGDRKPPLSIEDLGLHGQVRLVDQGLYFDGGSQFYLLADQAERLFAFCTSNPNPSESPAFLLGKVHFSNPGGLRVPLGSPSFEFLYRLVWSFSRDPRYRPDPETLRRFREDNRLSEGELDERMKEPNQPPDAEPGQRPPATPNPRSATPQP